MILWKDQRDKILKLTARCKWINLPAGIIANHFDQIKNDDHLCSLGPNSLSLFKCCKNTSLQDLMIS
jgi:hypothetical protein